MAAYPFEHEQEPDKPESLSPGGFDPFTQTYAAFEVAGLGELARRAQETQAAAEQHLPGMRENIERYRESGKATMVIDTSPLAPDSVAIDALYAELGVSGIAPVHEQGGFDLGSETREYLRTQYNLAEDVVAGVARIRPLPRTTTNGEPKRSGVLREVAFNLYPKQPDSAVSPSPRIILVVSET
jgi:hypothetical protein